MNPRALVIIAVIGIAMVFYNQSHGTTHANSDITWLEAQIDALKLKVKKIEALVTLMKSESPDNAASPEESEPLRESHLTTSTHQVPIVNASQATVGMEPSKEPTVSNPVPVVHASSGHVERRGIFGRREVFVPDQPAAGYQQPPANRGNNRPRLFRSCSGGRCG